MSLNSLARLKKKRKTIGRGGSRGGTSGRGHQGQGSRSGGSVGIAFEGGQMPLARRLPKRGFNNSLFKVEYEIINIHMLEHNFEEGATITKEALHKKGLIKNSELLVKILGSGKLSKKLIVHSNAISAGARKLIEELGGEVHLIREK